MPKNAIQPPSPASVAKLVHDLASPLTVLALCIPELEKRWGEEEESFTTKGAAKQELLELLELSRLASEEAQAKLRKLRERVEFLELETGK